MSQPVQLAYLGPQGSHSAEAIEALLKAHADSFHQPMQLLPYPSLGQIIAAVKQQQVQAALVPVENTIEGSVREILDALACDFDTPMVQLEWDRKIHHTLIRKIARTEGIETVVSHPQALAQCRQGLNNLLGESWQAEPALSTSQAVVSLLDRPETVAAIGTRSVAIANNLHIVMDNICHNPNNHTRFLLLSNEPSLFSFPQENLKTSICVALHNKPGSLMQMLAVLNNLDLNMSRIESRPAKTQLGEYVFYIDFEGAMPNTLVEQLAKVSTTVRLLGTYPYLTCP